MKKLLSVLLILVMVFAFAACGNSGSDNGNSGGSAAGESKDTLVMATNAAFPPYEYYEGDEIVGIDADIAQAIADKLGMKLEIQDMDFNSIITTAGYIYSAAIIVNIVSSDGTTVHGKVSVYNAYSAVRISPGILVV